MSLSRIRSTQFAFLSRRSCTYCGFLAVRSRCLTHYDGTQSAHNNSACCKTVLTASSCRSGGYPNRFSILFTITRIFARALSRNVQRHKKVASPAQSIVSRTIVCNLCNYFVKDLFFKLTVKHFLAPENSISPQVPNFNPDSNLTYSGLNSPKYRLLKTGIIALITVIPV